MVALRPSRGRTTTARHPARQRQHHQQRLDNSFQGSDLKRTPNHVSGSEAVRFADTPHQNYGVSATRRGGSRRSEGRNRWCARQESNLRPLASEAPLHESRLRPTADLLAFGPSLRPTVAAFAPLFRHPHQAVAHRLGAHTVWMPRNGGRVVFRTRFADYTGRWVHHCPVLLHEDHGMMQTVRST
ncbi:MAG: multicopper oxidase domain-containing protein, partial [Acidobacteria bacterium]|nr:multicopper oxidase domain-containing protein [Acidobacteriota bacterium]